LMPIQRLRPDVIFRLLISPAHKAQTDCRLVLRDRPLAGLVQLSV